MPATSRVRRTVSTLLLTLAAGGLAACGSEAPTPSSPSSAPAPTTGFAGSRSCRACHERFYALWAPSHHGTAMQPFTPDLARTFVPPEDAVEIGDARFRADPAAGLVREEGPGGERTWPIAHVMGGKNVAFFLTPFERGRLQVLPVAYDVDERAWYDTTASMVRHAGGHPDEPVAWTDPLLTFNTSCWACHVSQLSVNYDPATDTYDSVWSEPGINCETCHGPAEEHVRVCEEAPEGTVPADLRIIRVKGFDEQQTNDTCAPCHAKAVVVSGDFTPGARYFDHFDLVGLEDADFYVDGRDLGENYTFTLWRMSPCVKSGRLDCVHCHTSSGRYRFAGERTNEACLPCHEDHVGNVSDHTHHAADSPGSRCVACHMPMTEFARMRRSDHSMRPPAPSLTIEHGSPNACTLCHDDEDAAWADGHVRAWRERDYQAPMLHASGLVAAARARDWSRLDDMLLAIAAEDRDEILATSLLRLLTVCPDPRRLPTFLDALADPSPLVRSAAASGLDPRLAPQVAFALIGAAGDEFRLVRVRAASALASLPADRLPPGPRAVLARATLELEASFRARPDDWGSHYNLGNLHESRGDLDAARASYERAHRLRPDAIPPLVNLSMVHARQGHLGLAENALREAVRLQPGNPEANFNLGLLLAETGLLREARERLQVAADAEPPIPAASYNLAGLLADEDPERALELYRRSWTLDPTQPRYAHALALRLDGSGQPEEAVHVLTAALARGGANAEVYRLLVALHDRRGDPAQVRAVLRRAAADARLDDRSRAALQQQLDALTER